MPAADTTPPKPAAVEDILKKVKRGPVPLVDPTTAAKLVKRYGLQLAEGTTMEAALCDPDDESPIFGLTHSIAFDAMTSERRQLVSSWSAGEVQQAVHGLPEAYGLSLGVPLEVLDNPGGSWDGEASSTSATVHLKFKSGAPYTRADGKRFKRLVLADALYACGICGASLVRLSSAEINRLYDAPTTSVVRAMGRVIAVLLRPGMDAPAPPPKVTLQTIMKEYAALSHSSAPTQPLTDVVVEAPPPTHPRANKPHRDLDAFVIHDAQLGEEDVFDAIDGAVEEAISRERAKPADALSALAAKQVTRQRPGSAAVAPAGEISVPSTGKPRAQTAKELRQLVTELRTAVADSHTEVDIHFRQMSALTRRETHNLLESRKAAEAADRQRRLHDLRGDATEAGAAFGDLGAIAARPEGVPRLSYAQLHGTREKLLAERYTPGLMEIERRSDLLRSLYETTKGFVKVRRGLAKLQQSSTESAEQSSRSSPRFSRTRPTSSQTRPVRPTSSVSYVSDGSEGLGPAVSGSHSRQPFRNIYPLTVDWAVHACIRPVLGWDDAQSEASGTYLSRRLLGEYASLERALANAQFAADTTLAQQTVDAMKQSPLTFDLKLYRRLSAKIEAATARRAQRLQWLSEGGINVDAAECPEPVSALPSGAILGPLHRPKSLSAAQKLRDAIDTMHAYDQAALIRLENTVHEASSPMHLLARRIVAGSYRFQRHFSLNREALVYVFNEALFELSPTEFDTVVAFASSKFGRNRVEQMRRKQVIARLYNEICEAYNPPTVRRPGTPTATRPPPSMSRRVPSLVKASVSSVPGSTSEAPTHNPGTHSEDASIHRALVSTNRHIANLCPMNGGASVDGGFSVSGLLPTTRSEDVSIIAALTSLPNLRHPDEPTTNDSSLNDVSNELGIVAEVIGALDSSVSPTPSQARSSHFPVLRRVALAELVNHYLRLEHRSTSAAASRIAAMAATPGVVRSAAASASGQVTNFYAQSEDDAHFLFTLNLATRNRLLRADELRKLRLSPEEQLMSTTPSPGGRNLWAGSQHSSRGVADNLSGSNEAPPLRSVTTALPGSLVRPSSARTQWTVSPVAVENVAAPVGWRRRPSSASTRQSVVSIDDDLAPHLTRIQDTPAVRAYASYMPDEIGFEEFAQFVQNEWASKGADEFDSCALMLRTCIMAKRMQRADSSQQARALMGSMSSAVAGLLADIDSAPKAFETRQMSLQLQFETLCANTVTSPSTSPILLLLSPATLPDGSPGPDPSVLVEQYFWDGQNPRLREAEPRRFANSSYPASKQQQLHIFSVASSVSLTKALGSMREVGMPRGHWYFIDFYETALNRDAFPITGVDEAATDDGALSRVESLVQRERLRREVRGSSARSRLSSSHNRRGGSAGSPPDEVQEVQGGLMETFLRGLGTSIFQQRYGAISSSFRVFVRCPRAFIGANNLPSIAQRASHIVDLSKCVEVV